MRQIVDSLLQVLLDRFRVSPGIFKTIPNDVSPRKVSWMMQMMKMSWMIENHTFLPRDSLTESAVTLQCQRQQQ